MTLTTDEHDRLRRALSAYVDEAPSAPSWGSWQTLHVTRPHRRRLSGPAVAVASALLVILVIGGVAAVLRWTGPDLVTIGPEAVKTWEDWHQWVVSQSGASEADPSIVQGELGPEPQFDTTSLGVEQALEPGGRQLGDEPWSRFLSRHDLLPDQGPLVVAGVNGSSVVAVVPAIHEPRESVAVDGLCMVVARPDSFGEWASASTCRNLSDLVGYDDSAATPRLWIALGLDRASISMAVPPETSVVAVQSGREQYWQRPRGAMALFVGDFFAEETRFTFYSKTGEALAYATNQLNP